MNLIRNRIFRTCRRNVLLCNCVDFNSSTKHAAVDDKEHVVLVSKSTDIYENLALEDWLYEKEDMDKKSVLLIWKNKPAIVIGKHQNPWIECDVPTCLGSEIALARRKSGGGAVFHDEGNLNCSFLKCRQLYNRRLNLELVVRAVMSKWDVDLSINKKDDIILDGLYKISGTAAKLAGKRTYHHFTLLYDVDTNKLKKFLNSKMIGVESNATSSIPSPTSNLKKYIPKVNFDDLVQVIGQAFLSQGGQISYVDPVDEISYPGIMGKLSELRSRDWIFGRTPTFSIHRTFKTTFSPHFLEGESLVDLRLTINKGVIESVQTKVSPHSKLSSGCAKCLVEGLTGTTFWKDDVLKAVSDVKTTCIAQNLYEKNNAYMLDWFLGCVLKTCSL